MGGSLPADRVPQAEGMAVQPHPQPSPLWCIWNRSLVSMEQAKMIRAERKTQLSRSIRIYLQ